MSEIRGSEIRVSKIRVSEIRISSNHRELHGAIFLSAKLRATSQGFGPRNPPKCCLSQKYTATSTFSCDLFRAGIRTSQLRDTRPVFEINCCVRCHFTIARWPNKGRGLVRLCFVARTGFNFTSDLSGFCGGAG